MIAFYTQDPYQIEDIFNGSALVRDKWERREDYRNSTIKKALEGLSATWQPLGSIDEDKDEDGEKGNSEEQTWEAKLSAHILEWNAAYSSVLIGGKHRIMDKKSSPVRFVPEQDFAKVFRATTIQTGVSERGNHQGNPIYKSHFKAWIEHPAASVHKNVIFYPKKVCDFETYNLWRGFSVTPCETVGEPITSQVELIKSHIKEVISSGDPEVYEYLMNWIAYTFQHPDKPAGSAVIVRGKKGSGKGTLGHFLASIWGQHGLHISQTAHLVGNFNGHLAECCFLFADEAFFSGDKKHERVLKALITEPVMVIERKGIDPIQQPNFLKIYMATNSDFAVPASADERRFLVTDCCDIKIGDHAYFDKLYNAMKDHKVKAAFLYEMLNRNISKFHTGHIPETVGLKDQRYYSFQPHQEWLADCLKNGTFSNETYVTWCDEDVSNWKREISVQELYKNYEGWLKERPTLNKYSVGIKAFSLYLGNIFKRVSHIKMNEGHVRGSRGFYLGSRSEAIKSFECFEKVDLLDPRL